MCRNHSVVLSQRSYHTVMPTKMLKNSKQCPIWVCTICPSHLSKNLKSLRYNLTHKAIFIHVRLWNQFSCSFSLSLTLARIFLICFSLRDWVFFILKPGTGLRLGTGLPWGRAGFSWGRARLTGWGRGNRLFIFRLHF